MGQMYIILVLLIYTVGCGVKGAPLPRQDSAYIFNQKPNDEAEDQAQSSDENKESVEDDK